MPVCVALLIASLLASPKSKVFTSFTCRHSQRKVFLQVVQFGCTLDQLLSDFGSLAFLIPLRRQAFLLTQKVAEADLGNAHEVTSSQQLLPLCSVF